MTTKELLETFRKYDAEYLKFDEIPYEKRLSNRPDLHAFILLDRLVPGAVDIVSAAAHDEFWVSVEPEELAKVATEADVLELIRCGLRYDKDNDSFAFFS